MAMLITSIGDSSALLLLREACQGLRSPQGDDILYVDLQMTISERMRLIKNVGACTALLRLVRWLHIVKLWEDLSLITGDGYDGFVIVTPDSVTQRNTRKGNPRNVARAQISRGLYVPQLPQQGGPKDCMVRKSTRLRRLGQRLGLIGRKWGQGTLLILGEDFSGSR